MPYVSVPVDLHSVILMICQIKFKLAPMAKLHELVQKRYDFER